MPFWLSIGILSAFQGSLVAMPVRLTWGPLRRLRAGLWAAVLPVSVLAFVFIAREAEHASAQGLTYLALVAVPPLAVAALGWLSRGARPWRSLLAIGLFALAWADRGGLAGHGAAVVLSGLSCVALGTLLGAITPPRWLAVGIVAMALADTALVVSDLLQAPNDALNAAHPAAGLPRLQAAVFGSAVMGYGDLFVAGVLGGLLAAVGASQREGALVTIALALSFDLLFLFVDELPATVPVALAMIVVALRRRAGSAAGRDGHRRAAPVPAPAPARPAPRSPVR